MMRPTRMRGLSEPNGSWKTICMRWRAAQSSRAESVDADPAPRSGYAPRWARSAAGSVVRWSTCRSPIRPTSPSVSPGSSAKLTPSTARITRRRRGQPGPAHVELLREAAHLEQRAGHQLTTGQATKWPGSRSSRRGARRGGSSPRRRSSAGEAAARVRPAKIGRRSRRWTRDRLAEAARMRQALEEPARVRMQRAGEEAAPRAPSPRCARRRSRRRGGTARRPRRGRG